MAIVSATWRAGCRPLWERIRSSLSLPKKPSAAATWPCGKLRTTRNLCGSIGTTGSLRKTRRNASIFAAGQLDEAFVECIEVGINRLQYLTLTVEAKNEGRSFEGTEHDGDTAVLSEMSDGLGSAAREVLISDGMGIKDGACILALGRYINVATLLQMSRSNEQD